MTGDRGDLTSGDPLGGDPPRPAEAPPAAAPAPSSYRGDRVPPGAFTPRPREELSARWAGAEPAGWWQRAIAATIDAVIVGIAAAILLGLSFAPLNLDDGGGVAGAIVVGLVAILGITIGALLYAPLLMARTDGKTLGKMATGCRVVRADGRRIDFGWAALREVVVKALALGILAGMTGGLAYLADILWPLVDGRNRALHDIVVDSRVIRD
jgi:uncharacterized RDD family membrane protein YckC